MNFSHSDVAVLQVNVRTRCLPFLLDDMSTIEDRVYRFSKAVNMGRAIYWNWCIEGILFLFPAFGV